jgi:hypothetical protein
VRAKGTTTYLPIEGVTHFVRDFLNGTEQLGDTSGDELRMLVDEWLSVDGNWEQFVEKMLKAKQPFPSKGEFDIPSNAQHPILIPKPPLGSTHAHGVFLQLVLHPHSEMLCRPCQSCGQYFLKRTKHHKAYCSRKCVGAANAIPATKRRREANHAALLRWAKEAIAEWRLKKRRKDWKTWVVEYLRNKQKNLVITEKSLSRWVNKGELIAPKEKGVKA